MSTTNSILSAVAGAAIASGVWYASGPSEASALPTSPTPVERGEDTLAQGLTNTTIDCSALIASHAITYAQAKDYVKDYLGTPNRLTYDGTNTLKGWYIDRCIIEDLFTRYPNADGLQLYVGAKKETSTSPWSNNLVWMASQIVEVNGVKLRENCIALTNSVMDFASCCPNFCPDRNDLP